MKRILLLLLTPMAALQAADLALVENGQTRAEIIIAETRPRMTTLAALDLRHFIEKMSGARLPVVTTAGAAPVKIHVGMSAATTQLGVTSEGLRDGAYRIATGADWMVLLGADKDFVPEKMPWPLERKDVPRAEAVWKKLTAGKSDAPWGFPFGSSFKAYWNPADFMAQMTARYGEDFSTLWGQKGGFWNHDQAGSLNAVHDLLRQLGARFFMPGELGEVVPKKATLAVAMKFRDLLDAARKTAGNTIYGQRIQPIINELQPREEVIAKYRQRDEELAAARAKAPVATVGKEFQLKDNNSNKPVTVPTSFRVSWEANALVLDIVCHEREMKKLNIAPDVYNGDCVAISIETPLHSYYHIEINPDGKLFEGNPGGDWKSLAEVKTERGTDSWRVHVRLPVVGEAEAQSDPKHCIAGAKPTAAQPWYFNVGRQRVLDLRKSELQAFSPTKGGWHVPTKFGKLVME